MGSCLTNLSSASQVAVPPPTSLEAILHPPDSTDVGNMTADSRPRSIKNWTTVTTDGNLLVALFSAWKELEYSYYHYLELDAFLDDMASGDTDFCSALLVNALLASACVRAHCFYETNVSCFEDS